MLLRSRRRRSFALLAGILFWMPAEVAHAQQAPVAAIFSDDQKRDASLASSFQRWSTCRRRPLPPRFQRMSTPAPVTSSGHSDGAGFRPDAAIVPTIPTC